MLTQQCMNGTTDELLGTLVAGEKPSSSPSSERLLYMGKTLHGAEGDKGAELQHLATRVIVVVGMYTKGSKS